MDINPGPAGADTGRGPLAGVLVIALEQAVAAPLATRTLADLGARVIKVEHPVRGDFTRRYDDVARAWRPTSSGSTGARSRSASTRPRSPRDNSNKRGAPADRDGPALRGVRVAAGAGSD